MAVSFCVIDSTGGYDKKIEEVSHTVLSTRLHPTAAQMSASFNELLINNYVGQIV